MRIPGWARNEPVPSDLYRFADRNAGTVVLKVNGKAVPLQLEKGYVGHHPHMEYGRHVELDLPMPVRRVVANDHVAADRGRVALQRGPIVYAAEWVDNPDGKVRNLMLPDSAKLTAEYRPALLNGVGGDHGQGDRAGLRCPGRGREDRAGLHDDSLLRVGQSRHAAR